MDVVEVVGEQATERLHVTGHQRRHPGIGGRGERFLTGGSGGRRGRLLGVPMGPSEEEQGEEEEDVK